MSKPAPITNVSDDVAVPSGPSARKDLTDAPSSIEDYKDSYPHSAMDRSDDGILQLRFHKDDGEADWSYDIHHETARRQRAVRAAALLAARPQGRGRAASGLPGVQAGRASVEPACSRLAVRELPHASRRPRR